MPVRRHAISRSSNRPRALTVTAAAVAAGGLVLGGLGVPAASAAGAPKVSLRDVTVQEPSGGEALATLRAVLSRAVDRTVVVRWRTAGGSAVAGEDFTPRSGRAIIRAGSRATLIRVPVLGDAAVDGGKELRVRITKVKGAKVGKRIGRVRILDADTDVPAPPPGLVGLPTGLTVLEGLPVRLPLTLTSLPLGPLEVLWEVVPGSADAADFGERAGSTAFGTTDLSRVLSIPTVDDDLAEPDERASLVLTVVSGAYRSALATVPLTILDNDGADDGDGGPATGQLPSLGLGDSLPTDLTDLLGLGGSLPIPLSLSKVGTSDVTGVLTATVSTVLGDLPLASIPFTIPQGSLSPTGTLLLPLANLPVGGSALTVTVTQLTGAAAGNLTRTLTLPDVLPDPGTDPEPLPGLSLGTLPGSLTGLLPGGLPVPLSLDGAAPTEVTGVLTATVSTLLGDLPLASLPFTIPQGATSPLGGLLLPLTGLPLGALGVTMTVTELTGALPVGSLTRTLPIL
ncbi:hypothetical protein KLP28_04760 [Nocardioidaceae bacterium]|nr:hypothetical protein KLP28_04760 [Nocardioidaceae bacterium]